MRKVKAVQDDSCHWYLIPNELYNEFKKDMQEFLDGDELTAGMDFDTKWGQYRTNGDLNLIQLFIEN